MKQIIFICTGNTCRSPMAEGFFKAQDGEKRLQLGASSAGIFTQDGIPVTQNAVYVAKELGVDIAGHTARLLTADMVMQARYLVCMTGAHADRVMQEYPMYAQKVFTLSQSDIADPFGGTREQYYQVAHEIQQAIAQLITRLEKMHDS